VIVMATTLLTIFFVLHGLLHLGIWLPQQKPDAPAPPFVPDRSP
jgi:hypothetical protein